MEINDRLNPWAVSRIEEFLFFCCPECNERIQSKDKFIQHALENHQKSRTYLPNLTEMPPFLVMSKVPLLLTSPSNQKPNILSKSFNKSRENKKSKFSLLKSKMVDSDKKEVKRQNKRKSLMEISPSKSEIKIKTEPCDDDFQVDSFRLQLGNHHRMVRF